LSINCKTPERDLISLNIETVDIKCNAPKDKSRPLGLLRKTLLVNVKSKGATDLIVMSFVSLARLPWYSDCDFRFQSFLASKTIFQLTSVRPLDVLRPGDSTAAAMF